MRTPSTRRNRVRFAHITGADAPFAHPTVRRHQRVRYLSPGHLMSEFAACTVQAPGECCSAAARTATLPRLRSAQSQDVAWAEAGPCAHVLDWPLQTMDMVDGTIHTGAESERAWCRAPPRVCMCMCVCVYVCVCVCV